MNTLNTWHIIYNTTFLHFLLDTFEINSCPHLKVHALRAVESKLEALTQGKQTTMEFFIDFELYKDESGYNDVTLI